MFSDNKAMKDELILSIDIGTSAIKVGLFDIKDLNLITSLSQEYEIDYPYPNWAEQHPDVWYGIIVKLIRRLMKIEKYSENVIGIGISNTCPSLIPLDMNGNALRPAILFMDQRSIKQTKYILNKINLEEMTEITGNRIAPGTFSITSMLWIKDNEPEIYRKTYKFVHANGYIASKLTGEVGIDPTNASLTGIFDIKRIEWSNELISKIEFDESKLPPILWSYTEIGELSENVARELNLVKGIPVAMGAADSACTALGLGAIKPGRICETTGTSSVLMAITNIPKFDTRLLNRCHVKKDLWICAGAMSTTGASLKWFKDKFALYEVVVANELNVSPYIIIDKEASKSPVGANNLIFLPYMMGERCPIWNPYARGAIIGLSLVHSRADIARAILEGIAYGLRHNLEIMESLGIKINDIRVAGAATRSKLWNQIKADVLKKRIITSSIKEVTLSGAAILAGVAIKKFTDIIAITDSFYNKIHKIFKPNPENCIKYDKYYNLFKKCYEKLAFIFNELQIEEE